MRLSETAPRLAGERLVPELVLLLPIVSIERFLTPNVGSKPGLGLLLILLVSAATKAKFPLEGARTIGYGLPLALLVMVALTYRGGPYAQAAVFVIVFLILRFLAPTVTRASAYESLVAGIVLYLVLNILGWGLGLQSPTASGRLLGYETSSPIFSKRITFPFSTSINELPYPAAALVLAVAAMIKLGDRVRWYHWLGMLASSFVLLAANNRTAFAVVAVVGVVLILAPNALRAAAPYAVGISLLWPFVNTVVRPLEDLFIGILQENRLFSRGGTLGEFGGRQLIWEGLLQYWSTDRAGRGLSSTLFGYGPQGQVDSGAYLFIPRQASEFLQNRTFLHAHNSVLQIALDAGLLGALILWTATVFVVYRYSRESSALVPFVIALATASSGTFESGLVPGMNYMMVYIMIYLAFFLPAKTPSSPEPAVRPDRAQSLAMEAISDGRHRRY